MQTTLAQIWTVQRTLVRAFECAENWHIRLYCSKYSTSGVVDRCPHDWLEIRYWAVVISGQQKHLYMDGLKIDSFVLVYGAT